MSLKAVSTEPISYGEMGLPSAFIFGEFWQEARKIQNKKIIIFFINTIKMY